jgi:DNA-binding response OmpR family regulator
LIIDALKHHTDAVGTVPEHRGVGVLVVEDEMIVAAVIEAILYDAGYHVLGPFYSPKDGLEAIGTFRPDVALLDMSLTRGTSFELADELDRRSIPFVLVSGTPCGMLEGRYQNRPFLTKPFGISELLKTIEAVARVDVQA